MRTPLESTENESSNESTIDENPNEGNENEHPFEDTTVGVKRKSENDPSSGIQAKFARFHPKPIKGLGVTRRFKKLYFAIFMQTYTR